jgi:hypothetical protein
MRTGIVPQKKAFETKGPRISVKIQPGIRNANPWGIWKIYFMDNLRGLTPKSDASLIYLSFLKTVRKSLKNLIL